MERLGSPQDGQARPKEEETGVAVLGANLGLTPNQR